jgi:hypothetical protein
VKQTFRATVAALVLVGGACTTVTYPGPRRPSDQVALLEARDVAIDEIDGLDVRGKGARFEVLPGDHQLVVHLAKVTRIPLAPTATTGPGSLTITRHSASMPLCISARPEHFYMLEPSDGSALWEPIVYDGSPDLRVPPCGPVAVYYHNDFACGGEPSEERLAEGVRKVSGCGRENIYGYDLATGQWRSVTERAMYDMSCSAGLEVRHLGGTTVSVTGCGLRATYTAGIQCAKGLCTFRAWEPSVVNPR